MKTKTSVGLLVLLALGIVLLALGIAAWRLTQVRQVDRATPAPPAAQVATRPPAAPPRPAKPTRPPAIEISDVDVIDGRVLDAATHEGVPDAKLVFRGAGGDATFTTSSDGTFELTPPATGERSLVTVTAPGYLRYVPVRAGTWLTLARGAAVPRRRPVQRHVGLERRAVTARWLIDPRGRFAVRVPRGDYELMASAGGHAASAPIRAAAGATDLRIVLGNGATLRGQVIASDDQTPIGNASVEVERATRMVGSGATGVRAMTRADGSFELPGVPAGPLSLGIHADGYHMRIESGPTAREGAVLGPITIALTRVGAGEPVGFERVGIGIGFGADGDALQISWVLPGTSAADAGVQTGDRLLAIDGVPVEALGVDGAFAALGGQPGTTVTLTLQRDGQLVQLAVERRLLRT